MKNLRSLIALFVLKGIDMRTVSMISAVLLATTFFYSCSDEDEPLNKSGKIDNKEMVNDNNVKENSVIIKEDLIKQNVNSFSVAIFSNYGSLEDALNKNLSVGFNNPETMQMLNNAKNENDLKIVFQRAGIANSQEVIDILKNIVEVQHDFIVENPNFYNLTKEQQVEYLNSSVETAKNSFMVVNPPVLPTIPYFTTPGCAHNYNTGISRCNTDFGVCGVFAVAGTYAGILPGLLAAAYCMTTKVICDKRVYRDFKDCQAQEIIKNGGPNGEPLLMLQCDRDSCWANDLSGKYFGRVIE